MHTERERERDVKNTIGDVKYEEYFATLQKALSVGIIFFLPNTERLIIILPV